LGAPVNDAAEMNESVESDAFVMPSRSGRPLAGCPAVGQHALVLFVEPELVHLLVGEEFGVTDILDLHPPHEPRTARRESSGSGSRTARKLADNRTRNVTTTN
jgi:hypothetical protein